jgi:hypothetical protein
MSAEMREIKRCAASHEARSHVVSKTMTSFGKPAVADAREIYFGTPYFHFSQWATTSLMKGADAAKRLFTAGTNPSESPSGPHPHNECQAVSPTAFHVDGGEREPQLPMRISRQPRGRRRRSFHYLPRGR